MRCPDPPWIHRAVCVWSSCSCRHLLAWLATVKGGAAGAAKAPVTAGEGGQVCVVLDPRGADPGELRHGAAAARHHQGGGGGGRSRGERGGQRTERREGALAAGLQQSALMTGLVVGAKADAVGGAMMTAAARWRSACGRRRTSGARSGCPRPSRTSRASTSSRVRQPRSWASMRVWQSGAGLITCCCRGYW